jgi:hypothetical protein
VRGRHSRPGERFAEEVTGRFAWRRNAHKDGEDWFKKIHPLVIEDCCQLVKANSIKGNKQDNVSVVFTPASNLKKTQGMETGQVR